MNVCKIKCETKKKNQQKQNQGFHYAILQSYLKLIWNCYVLVIVPM